MVWCVAELVDAVALKEMSDGGSTVLSCRFESYHISNIAVILQGSICKDLGNLIFLGGLVLKRNLGESTRWLTCTCKLSIFKKDKWQKTDFGLGNNRCRVFGNRE